MKASRAPGPVQSTYVQNHRQRMPKVQPERKPKKTENSSAASDGGVVKRFVNLDEIPDFPNDDVDVWNSMSNQKQQSSYPPSMSNNKNTSTNIVASVSYEVRSVNVRQDGNLRREVIDEDEIDDEEYNEKDDDDNEWNTPYGNNKQHQAPPPPSSSAYKSTSSTPDYKRNAHGGNYQNSPPKQVQFQSQKPSSSAGQRQVPYQYQQHHDSSDEDEKEIEEDLFQYDYGGMSSPKKAIPNPPNNAPNSSQYNQHPNTGNTNGKGKVTGKPSSLPPPQLPYDAAAAEKEKPLTENEKLFYSKKPRAVEYKPYTLDQYKLIKPKEYVEIGNIKPDLHTDELIAKRKNAERIKEFSRQLRDINKETIIQQPKLPPSQEQSGIQLSRQKQESRRQRALEFAKNIPKPRVATVQEEEWKRSQSAGESRGGGGLCLDEDTMQAAKLEELLNRHNQGKAKMEAIKKTLLH